MHHYKSHYFLVYNLPTLLGPDHLRALRESSPTHFGGQYAVVKTKRTTTQVQMELWKLLGYLVQDEKSVKNPAAVLDSTSIRQELDFDALRPESQFEEALVNVLTD